MFARSLNKHNIDLPKLLRLLCGIVIEEGGERKMIRLGVTGVKGDWPFLAKAGCLERHFGRAPKKGESRIAPKAICHLCLTGLPGYHISECSNNPRFEQTMEIWFAMN